MHWKKCKMIRFPSGYSEAARDNVLALKIFGKPWPKKLDFGLYHFCQLYTALVTGTFLYLLSKARIWILLRSRLTFLFILVFRSFIFTYYFLKIIFKAIIDKNFFSADNLSVRVPTPLSNPIFKNPENRKKRSILNSF